VAEWKAANPAVERTDTALSCGAAAHLLSVIRRVTLSMKKERKMLAIYCSTTIAIVALLTGCSEPQPTSSTSGSTVQVSSEKKKEWYEGGDLHRASIGQWNAATYENKLATSADMVANLKKFSSVEDMKAAAVELEQCVSKAAEGAQAEQQQVTEVAAACALLLGYR
jgi:hypothetical protein